MPRDSVAAHKTWIRRRGGLGLTIFDLDALAEAFGFADLMEFEDFATRQQAKEYVRSAG